VIDPSYVDDQPTRIRSARRPAAVGVSGGARSPQGLRFALPPFVHAVPPTGASAREPALAPGAERGRADRSGSGSGSAEGALADDGAGQTCADTTIRRLDTLGSEEGGFASDGDGDGRQMVEEGEGAEGGALASGTQRVLAATESSGLRHRRGGDAHPPPHPSPPPPPPL
jgi:hypothetical protein